MLTNTVAVKPNPTILSIEIHCDYKQTLEEARDAMGYTSRVSQLTSGKDFPPEGRTERRQFALICFHRAIGDSEDPKKSELLRELKSLSLEPEGALELCFVPVDECVPKPHENLAILARRQTCEDRMFGGSLCLSITNVDGESHLMPIGFKEGHLEEDWFLVSRM